MIVTYEVFLSHPQPEKIQIREYERIRKENKDVKVVGTEVEIVYDLVA